MQEPLVLVAGAMCDGDVFAPQLTALSPEMAVTVAPISGGDRIEEIASGLLDSLPRKFALAGMAMGGTVALELMRRAPDRVSRLCLISTNSLAETPQSAADYEPIITKLRAGLIEQAVAMCIAPDHLAPGPQRTAMLNHVVQMAQNLGPDRTIRQLRALQRRRDYQATLRKIQVPALVMCGMHDRVTPVKHHEFMAGLIPYAELALVQDAGHLPTLEAPDAVTAALRAWLKQPFVLQRRAEAV